MKLPLRYFLKKGSDCLIFLIFWSVYLELSDALIPELVLDVEKEVDVKQDISVVTLAETIS